MGRIKLGSGTSKNLINTIRSFQQRVATFRWLMKHRKALSEAQLKMILEHPPWESMQLSKAERKGKTVEQIRELRKQKYEQEIKNAAPSDS
jgi:hypothetical protein